MSQKRSNINLALLAFIIVAVIVMVIAALTSIHPAGSPAPQVSVSSTR